MKEATRAPGSSRVGQKSRLERRGYYVGGSWETGQEGTSHRAQMEDLRLRVWGRKVTSRMPGVMGHTCHPSTREAEDEEVEASLDYIVKSDL